MYNKRKYPTTDARGQISTGYVTETEKSFFKHVFHNI